LTYQYHSKLKLLKILKAKKNWAFKNWTLLHSECLAFSYLFLYFNLDSMSKTCGENIARLMSPHDVCTYGWQLELQFYSHWGIARGRRWRQCPSRHDLSVIYSWNGRIANCGCSWKSVRPLISTCDIGLQFASCCNLFCIDMMFSYVILSRSCIFRLILLENVIILCLIFIARLRNMSWKWCNFSEFNFSWYRGRKIAILS